MVEAKRQLGEHKATLASLQALRLKDIQRRLNTHKVRYRRRERGQGGVNSDIDMIGGNGSSLLCVQSISISMSISIFCIIIAL